MAALIGTVGQGLKNLVGGLPFGVGYATGTKIGFEGVGEWLSPIFPAKQNAYYGKRPTNFRLPYYRYSRRFYRSRYSRFRRRKPRFFRRYRTRRFY